MNFFIYLWYLTYWHTFWILVIIDTILHHLLVYGINPSVMSGARNVYWRVLVIIHIFNFISTLYNHISSKVISSSFNGFWISSFVKFNRCVYISYVWKKGLHFLNRITHIYLHILFLLLFILKSYAIKYNSQLFFLLFTIFSIWSNILNILNCFLCQTFFFIDTCKIHICFI